jgi:hypothetical protein
MITDEALDAMLDRNQRDLYGAFGMDVHDLVLEVRRLQRLLGSHTDGHLCTCTEIHPGSPWEPADWEQDPWCPTHPNMTFILQEVARFREHSVTLNTVSYRIAELLGRVTRPDDYEGDVGEDLERLGRRARAQDWTATRRRAEDVELHIAKREARLAREEAEAATRAAETAQENLRAAEGALAAAMGAPDERIRHATVVCSCGWMFAEQDLSRAKVIISKHSCRTFRYTGQDQAAFEI